VTSSEIAVVDADGSDRVRLSPDPPIKDGYPAWSPDGSQIAFARGPYDASAIYVMDADGENAHLVTDGSEPDWQPLVPPRHLHPPRVGADPREGRPVAAARGLWLGTPTVAFAYQWSRCDGEGQNCADIAGATDRVYTPTHDDVMNRLQVTVTATNDYGSAPGATSVPSAVVGESLVGTLDDEFLVGTPGSDFVSGLGGLDWIALGDGNDVGLGGYGNDSISGGDGNDILSGGPAHDRIRAGSGRDRIYARDGYRDLISCGAGRDFVRADRRDRVASNCEVVRYG
jgi:Ca2+-binding RTX toxin-like protein